ncbi:glycoside hydrolase family 9 protein [Roseateles oligotrophus]|uniref:Glycoside hydrolase family 9 protein n=1 Tax=Roseateles oligotrophus TaxID=1769250 RepID=A0ABT2Y9T7_9BURK|nr:glycoside hydrolase family 9 protein [Roseateles oligotrophus]MCV2367075.1 glycoside hydrolase family 9 protein [Roseateles oligotrophus]
MLLPFSPGSFQIRRAVLLALPCALLGHTAIAKEKVEGLVSLPSAALQVHINQVALERLGPKVAMVSAKGPAVSGRYRVLRDGQVQAEGPLTALPAFEAWTPGRKHFEVDFSQLTQAGRYQVDVWVGGRHARSAPVHVEDQALFRRTAAALLDYFKQSRHTDPGDRHRRVFETDRFVDVWGGWNDAGGDTGKYLSHLGYANHFNPQQAPLAAWVLAHSAHQSAGLYARAGLLRQAQDEAFWGADYLHRVLDPAGYFYTTVFDKWGAEGAERMVVGYEGEEGVYTSGYRSAYRAGGGMAIAALARAAMLARSSGRQGEYSAQTYLDDARRAFAHLQTDSRNYTADGQENLIDDYTALLAAVELQRATAEPEYLQAARERVAQMLKRQDGDGHFYSDAVGQRPYYHAVEAGLPVIGLSHYLAIETDPAQRAGASAAIAKALAAQQRLDQAVPNPYAYARQRFRQSAPGAEAGPVETGFFIPHRNETGYWWQGESARLASLSTAMVLGGRALAPLEQGSHSGGFGVTAAQARSAQAQLDWTLGRNPYGISMLYGFGALNPPAAPSAAGVMLRGGVSNGITGAPDSDAGTGIAFASGPTDNQWRWNEQWLPHTAWLLMAAVTMAQ